MGQKHCYCSTYGCNGKLTSKSAYHRHLQKDNEYKLNNPIEAVKEKFSYWPKQEEQILLHEGSQKTVVAEVAKKVAIFADNNGYTKSVLAQSIKDYKDSLPSPNNFPGSYLEARRIISPYLLPKVTYDTCVNDCILFRKYSDTRDLRKASECDVCHEPRYKSSKVKIPRKKIAYIGLEAQLLKRFGETNIAKLVFAGDVELQKPDLLRDFHDGANYQEWMETVFTNAQAAVPFGLMTDGLNPNRNSHIQRSMWPMFLSMLSFKGKYRNLLGVGLLLISVVPGLADKEPKSLQMILDRLVDELLDLAEVKISPSYTNAPTSVKCALLYTVCDFPAYAKVFLTAGQAACRACPYCMEFAPYEKQLSKCVHAGNRKYLDTAHPLRKQSKLFPCTAAVTESAPPRINYQTEVEEREKYDELTVASHKSVQLKATGFQGKYALQRLDYHNRLNQTSPDGMHTIADVIGNLMHFLLGKSSFKEKQHEVNIGRLKKPVISKTTAPVGLHHKTGSSTAAYLKVHVKGPWELDKLSLKTAEERLQSLLFPPNSSLRPDQYFTKPSQLSKMEMKMRFVSENVLVYCISGLIGKRQEETLRLFSTMISQLIQDEHDVAQLLDFKVKSQTILALIERDFPVSLQNITTHLLHHLIDSIEEFGPLQGRWLFPLERSMSWISRQTLNKHHQEATIIETYLLYEWIQWLRLVGKLEPSSINSSPVFLSLLQELGVHSGCTSNEGKVFKTCMLSNVNRSQLADKLQISMAEVDPQIHLFPKVSLDRNGCNISYHTEKADAQRSLKAHYVCWSLETNNFTNQQKEVNDIKEFSAGSIQSLVKAKVQGSTRYLARITQFEPQSYQIGGIWCCSLTSPRPPVLLPLTALSPPLIVDKRESIIYFINTKVMLAHAELAAFNDRLMDVR